MSHKQISYLYTYSCYEEELDLCQLEMRSLFGYDSMAKIIESKRKIDPSRSPFIKERIEIFYSANSIEEVVLQVQNLELDNRTFKVISVKNPALPKSKQIPFEERRKIERELGQHIPGVANIRTPDLLLGIIHVNDHWIFGKIKESEPIWHYHQRKPQHYSTALNTRVARAVVNIAVPSPSNMKAIDPCCGIGTVLVEALSMGINIVGTDINPLAVRGARVNLHHFQLGSDSIVRIQDMRTITDKYDVAIIDMPYNLCSVLSDEEKLEMLQATQLFAEKIVIVTIEPLDSFMKAANLIIKDRCVVKKGLNFQREVLVCGRDSTHI